MNWGPLKNDAEATKFSSNFIPFLLVFFLDGFLDDFRDAVFDSLRNLRFFFALIRWTAAVVCDPSIHEATPKITRFFGIFQTSLPSSSLLIAGAL
jgi:hypothetical protein